MPLPLGLVPAPVHLTADSDRHYVVGDGARVHADTSLLPAARWWRRATEDAFGVDLVPAPVAGPVSASPPLSGTTPAGAAPSGATPAPDGPTGTAPIADVAFVLGQDLPPSGYRLTVGDGGVLVEAADLAGAYAAAQTLRQLAGPQAFRRAPVPTRDPLTGPGDATPSDGTAGHAPAGNGAPGHPTTGVALPHVSIADHPSLAWRGVLLDVARHFLPKADVLRFVDLAAAHKLNVLQLHLTDDQGWRMQIRRYPRLTEVGGWRRESNVGTWRAGVFDGRPHGGFYTQDDLREIVAYARERGVTVVPEIEVPGHVEAAVAAYPELGTRKVPHEVRTTWGVSTEVLDPSEETVAFFRDVLDEVVEVFDSPWIALGGDEVPSILWRENPAIVARSVELGLSSVEELHGWFLARLCEHVRAAGRRPVVWDEAFGPALPTDAVVTAWRGYAVAAHAMAAGHDVVLGPEQVTYLDHRAGDGDDEPVPVGFLRTVEDVYAFEPLPAAMRSEFPGLEDAPGAMLGAQAQVWAEHLDSARRVDYAAFPRLAAFAEAVWSPAADRSVGSPASADFMERLEHHHLPRLDAAGVEYRPLAGPHPWQARPGVAGFPRDLAAETAEGGWAGVGGWVEGRELG